MPFTGEELRLIEERVGFPVCGAKNKQGTCCINKAGKGTDHLGSGRCMFHGGRQMGPTSKNWKHGRYATIQHPLVVAKMEELSGDTQVFDLRHQILQLKALTELTIEKGDFLSAQRGIVDISKVVERLHNIEVGRKYLISIENVGSIISTIKDVIYRHVQDEFTRKRIAEDLANIQFGAGTPKVIDGDSYLLPSHEEA